MEQPRITKKILDFVHVLQAADVTISPAEILDVMTALAHVDYSDRDSFRQALATTLIKDYTDLPVFNRCFGEFFERKNRKGESQLDAALDGTRSRGDSRDALEMSDEQLQSALDALDRYLDGLDEEALFNRSPREILNLLLEDPVLSSSSGAIGMLIMNARSRNTRPGSADEGSGEGNAAEGILLPHIRRRIEEKDIGRSIKRRDDYLLHKFIYQLKPDEVREMRELIRRFGQKLRNRISLRKKKVRHGGFDVKKTLRMNLRFGGTPFKLYFRDRKIDRPQLVVMCDISSSVNQFSRFMLLLTYTLQGLFSKVRTFAFISNIVEITPKFMEMDPERALNSIFTDTDFTYGFGSNYGRCFNQFVREYGDSLTRKTSVLILGDARNNNQDPGLDSFIRIKERSRNIFWLNPDRRHLWDWSDSIAGVYLPHCKEMKEVKNFLDLSEFIDKLFIR